MLLEVTRLTAGYRAPVVREVSFTLAPGEMVALLGPNGCGKSTLLRGISGSGRVFSGSVTVCGADCLAMTARQRARKLALLPQRVGVLPGLTAREVIGMGRYAHSGLFGGPGPGDAARVEQAARTFGVEQLLEKDCAALSEGQRQLIHLCRVAVQDAPVILLDEPNSALDFSNTHRLFAALRGWIAGGQRGALVVLHDPALALRWCDRVLVMQGGAIRGELTPGGGAGAAQAALAALYPGLRIWESPGGLVCTLDSPGPGAAEGLP